MSTQTTGPMIVVGVDGSPPSKGALRWAVRYAELTGARVHALPAQQRAIYEHRCEMPTKPSMIVKHL